MTDPTHVDLVFPARGQLIPRDHGYALYGAISRAVPGLHGASWLAIQGIEARLVGVDELTLHPRGALRVRIPVERVSTLLGLAGKQLELKGRSVVLGPPSIHPLQPAAVLDARLVAIRLTGGVKAQDQPFDREQFSKRFLAEAERQLARAGLAGKLDLRGRASIEVGGRRVIGYAVQVSALSPDHSIKLQIAGLGGKRTMGCGVFRPARLRA
jgi:CRISPR-associated protein Cas6